MKRTLNATLDIFAHFLQNKCGATAIEYTLIASLISITIIVGAGMVGSSTQALFSHVAEEVAQATSNR